MLEQQECAPCLNPDGMPASRFLQRITKKRMAKSPLAKPAGFDLASGVDFRDPGTSAEIPNRLNSHGAKIFRAGLATHAVELRFERNLLTFVERAQAGTLDGADVHEHVVAAIVRLNEAEALGRVEPLNCSGSHFNFSKMRKCAVPARPSRELDPISAMSWGVGPFRRDQQANRLFE
jgi:hypothetical protein